MVESTKERTERATDQAFARTEDTMGTMMDNGRRTLQSVMEFNRNSINSGYEFVRSIQEENLRLTDAWLDQITRFQKTALKSFQNFTTRMQDYTEQAVRDNQERLEETIDQSMEIVTPVAPRSTRRR